MQHYKWAFILFLFGFYRLAEGQSVLRQSQDLTASASFLVDSARELTVEKILLGEHQTSFRPLPGITPPIQKHYHYWLRVPLGPNTEIRNWWLIIKTSDKQYTYYAQWDDMHAYTTKGNNILHHSRSGVETPRSQKDVRLPAGANVVPVSADAHDSVVMYLHLDAGMEGPVPGKIMVELRDPSLGIPDSSISSLLFSLSTAALIVGILSLFFFLFVRERAYFFFFLYLLFLAVHYQILHPAIPFINWFIPEMPQVVDMSFIFFGIGTFILLLLFGRYFINLQRLSPKTDRWYMIFIYSWTLIVVTEIVLMFALDRHVFYPALFILLVLAIVFMIRIAFFKDILARFYVVGAAWLLFFSLMGIYFNDFFTGIGLNPWPIGQVGQILIYMAGLAYKMRMHEQARAEAYRIRDLTEIKSKFFANISHEFRTPLTLIRGILQVVQERFALNEKKEVVIAPKQLDTMQRHADRLLELVNQLLDLSRLDSGVMSLQVSTGDVVQPLNGLCHSFDTIAERKGIYYRMHFPDHHPIVYFDKDKLEKIFTNLLSNAFKYTPERGTISVSVEINEERLRITVEDSGAGIDKKELDKVFDRFYRVEGTDDKGSGIGLALVKELVDLYRGQLSVDSTPGKGSQFRVSIPVNPGSFHENEMIRGKEMIKTTSTFPVDPVEEIQEKDGKDLLPVALIIEDNADLRQFIAESIEIQYNVMEAKDGSAGLLKAVSEIPDIIISDVMMPGMDGFTLTTHLKKDERTSHIPVILLTAKAGQSHKIEGLETGADDYLTKPFDTKELLTRMQNLIDGRKVLRKKFAGAITLKPSEVSSSSLDSVFLEKVMTAIEGKMHEDAFGVEELAKDVAMSRSQLHRKLIALVDKSPSELIRQTRLLRAKSLLNQKAATPAEVAFRVGFNSHSYFTKCFKEEFGINPSEV